MNVQRVLIAVVAVSCLAAGCGGPSESAMESIAVRAIQQDLDGKEWCNDPQGFAWPCVKVDSLLFKERRGDSYCFDITLLVETTRWDDAEESPSDDRTYIQQVADDACITATPPVGDASNADDWFVDSTAWFLRDVDPTIDSATDELCNSVPGCTPTA